jgi:carboxymethylenebutenolidase
MVELWEQHTAYEFELRDADLAVSTMVDDATVMHLPTMSGGVGKENRLFAVEGVEVVGASLPG